MKKSIIGLIEPKVIFQTPNQRIGFMKCILHGSYDINPPNDGRCPKCISMKNENYLLMRG